MLCAAMLCAFGAGPAQARSGAQYRVEGRGWGHGIGMSQYGADGYAEHGWTYDQIIEHYFTGTKVAARPADGPASLRVLLQSYLAPARVEMTSMGTVSQGDRSWSLFAGDVVEFRAVGQKISVVRVRGGASTTLGSGTEDPQVVPAVDGGVKILFAADHARSGTSFRGTLSAHRFEGKVSIVNTVPFEHYVRGVVPDEMPPSWHAEALKAQAVAARSYALTHIGTSFSWFDVYSDTRSQVYGGRDAEEATTDAAVAATEGLVARIGGASGDVATTFFFSTSAGRTANNEDVWGSSPYSYLRSVPSPYEQSSKYFLWTGDDVHRYTPAQIIAKLGGVNGRFRGIDVPLHSSGYADSAVVRGTGGNRTIDADDVQVKLGLRSTFFRIHLLSVTAPNTARTGTFVRIVGRAPRSGVTQLVVRRGSRRITVRVTPNSAGIWTVRTRLTGVTVASLVRGGLAGPSVVVRPA